LKSDGVVHLVSEFLTATREDRKAIRCKVKQKGIKALFEQQLAKTRRQ